MTAAAHDDDEPDLLPCYRHPDRPTALACITCDRPICTECAVQAAVGFKCPDDARQSRAARAMVPRRKLMTGVAAGALTALVGGSVLATIHIPFVGLILAYLLGIGVGEVTKRASGGYRDPLLTRAAIAAAVVGILLLPLLDLATHFEAYGANAYTNLGFKLLAAIVAGFGARNRASS